MFGSCLETIYLSQATAADIIDAARPSGPLHWISILVLLDQLPRNCYRGARARIAYTFFDILALDVSYQAIERKIPTAPEVRFRLAYAIWFYMPLEHSESMEVQETLSRLHFNMWQDFERLIEKSSDGLDSESMHCRMVLLNRKENYEKFKSTMCHIVSNHEEMIRRFARFPHRNDALGRCSTEEELQFLQQKDGV